jgi:phosphate transport system substrate-binding protein
MPIECIEPRRGELSEQPEGAAWMGASNAFPNAEKSLSMIRSSWWCFALLMASMLPFCAKSSTAADILRVQGSTTVNPVVADALEILQAEQGLSYRIDTQGGSSGGLYAIGRGTVEVGMSSATFSEQDRARFPERDLRAVAIGYDALALIVSADVWQGGVRSLSAAEMRGIYEGRIRNWSEVGGSDQRIVFFNKEPGRGTWKSFIKWLYGSEEDAPLVNHPEVGSNAETRNKVIGTRGALSQLSAAWVDGEQVFALGIRDAEGQIVFPTQTNLSDGSYPLTRPLNLLISGPPEGEVQLLIEFLLGPRGDELIRKHGYLPSTAE